MANLQKLDEYQKGEAKTKTKKVERKEEEKKPKKVKKQFIIQNKFPSVFAGGYRLEEF